MHISHTTSDYSLLRRKWRNIYSICILARSNSGCVLVLNLYLIIKYGTFLSSSVVFLPVRFLLPLEFREITSLPPVSEKNVSFLRLHKLRINADLLRLFPLATLPKGDLVEARCRRHGGGRPASRRKRFVEGGQRRGGGRPASRRKSFVEGGHGRRRRCDGDCAPRGRLPRLRICPLPPNEGAGCQGTRTIQNLGNMIGLGQTNM